jgi:hypothetical protein
VKEMTQLGFSNVKKEEVMVPKWVRGNEYAELLQPYPRKLAILGLV